MPWRECSVMDERRFYKAEGTGCGSRTPNFVALGQAQIAQDDARDSHESRISAIHSLRWGLCYQYFSSFPQQRL
jgi:hypothetical protein